MARSLGWIVVLGTAWILVSPLTTLVPVNAHLSVSNLRAAKVAPLNGTALNWTAVPVGRLHPPKLYSPVMVYDAADGYLLYVGGKTNPSPSYSVILIETWSYLGGRWHDLTNTSDAPRPEYFFDLTYDAADRQVVLYGGIPYGARWLPLTETWTYSAGIWRNLTHVVHPPPSEHAAMAYDAKDGYVVRYGGYWPHKRTYENETWIFRGGNWSEIFPKTPPPAEWLASMAYDAKAQCLVLAGGTTKLGPLNGTWEFSGGNWTPALSAGLPPTSSLTAMTYDSKAGVVVILGIWAGVPFAGTWIFDNGVWKNITGASGPPTVGEYSTMGYDTARGYVLWFYGWKHSSTAWKLS